VDGDFVTLMSDGPFSSWEAQGAVPIESAHLLSPVLPSKVVCVGLNYRTHIAEMGHEMPTEPVIFLKPPTAVIGDGEPIVLPGGVGRVDYEGELALVIGRRTHDVTPSQAEQNVLGIVCANDVTARELQKRDGQWTRAKGFDGFCPVGPWIVSDADPRDLEITTLVNGEERQSARTSDMVFDPYELVSFISGVMTLLPGDVVLTGTPGGIGELHDGDSVEVRIEGVGTLANPVTARGRGAYSNVSSGA
jgi:2-keto-4-pentenoate hydratase/2-oxohepta-3-ene-1,7-dioic acid hydratase in catechol pathway